ncbi:hypothetical protein LTS02_017736, partial [Friedmanniomyces endolithicus]
MADGLHGCPRLTQPILEAVFYPTDLMTESKSREDIKGFAKSLRERYKGTISSWDEVNPQEVRAALDLVNAQLSSEGIKEVSSDVFRWRMLQTVRYMKRRPITGQCKSSIGEVAQSLLTGRNSNIAGQ